MDDEQQPETGGDVEGPSEQPSAVTEENATVETEKSTTEFPNAGRDAELAAQQHAELEAERGEHIRRTAGGDPQ